MYDGDERNISLAGVDSLRFIGFTGHQSSIASTRLGHNLTRDGVKADCDSHLEEGQYLSGEGPVGGYTLFWGDYL